VAVAVEAVAVEGVEAVEGLTCPCAYALLASKTRKFSVG
jgi:hypothetical protein